jgi:pimeloyl-ACP methyl ester carboxylesterase
LVRNISYLFEAPDVIHRIDCPTLLLTARAMMPGATLEAGLAAFTDNWRAGEHVHFADSGHFIMFDQFERFIAVLGRFLSAPTAH